MGVQYQYHYAIVRENNGLCTGTLDSSSYTLNRTYVPIDDADKDYPLKYYWPLPETVTSFDDFQGKWYTSSTYETEWIPE